MKVLGDGQQEEREKVVDWVTDVLVRGARNPRGRASDERKDRKKKQGGW